MGSNNRKHGLCLNNSEVDPVYKIHANILQRCFNIRDSHYEWYGGIGIGMHPEWVLNVVKFREYVLSLPSYKPRLTLDRVDPKKSYEPANLRWLTKSQQRINRKSGHDIRQSYSALVTGTMSLPHMGMVEYLQRTQR